MNGPLPQPAGLTPQQLERLEHLMRHSRGFSPQNLLTLAYSHLDDVQGIRSRQPEIEASLPMAELYERVAVSE